LLNVLQIKLDYKTKTKNIRYKTAGSGAMDHAQVMYGEAIGAYRWTGSGQELVWWIRRVTIASEQGQGCYLAKVYNDM
jgi:hypothetical protein